MRYYLSLGSNLGDRLQYLQDCYERFAQNPRINRIKKSAVYTTKPWGKVDQPDFFNAVLEIEADLTPRQLLQFCQALEDKAGRQRREHWGPRTLDIDILYAEGCQVDEADLKIPHPLMTQRLFVLRPLADLSPDLILAQDKARKSVRQWRDALKQDAIIKKLYESDQW